MFRTPKTPIYQVQGQGAKCNFVKNRRVDPGIKSPINLTSKSTCKVEIFLIIDVKTLKSTTDKFSTAKFVLIDFKTPQGTSLGRFHFFLEEFTFYYTKRLLHHIGKPIVPKIQLYECVISEMGSKTKNGEASSRFFRGPSRVQCKTKTFGNQ